LRNEKGVAEPEQYLGLPVRYRDVQTQPGAAAPSPARRLSDLPGSPAGSPPPASPPPRAPDEPVLVLQDLFTAGYHPATQERMDEGGLDFNHSIMAVSRLARFHAVSYALRRERGRDLRLDYPFLQEDPVYREDTRETFAKVQTSVATRLFNILQHAPSDVKNFSSFFLDSVRKMHQLQSEALAPSDDFDVLCHGDLWRQNVLFFYGSSLECQTDCVDVRFEDLHKVR